MSTYQELGIPEENAFFPPSFGIILSLLSPKCHIISATGLSFRNRQAFKAATTELHFIVSLNLGLKVIKAFMLRFCLAMMKGKG